MIGRDRITIEEDSSADGSNIPDYSGLSFMSGVPCEITYVRGQETYRGRQLEALVDYAVEARHLTGLNTRMRLAVTGGFYKGRNLNIVAVQQLPFSKGRPPRTVFLCREIPA